MSSRKFNISQYFSIHICIKTCNCKAYEPGNNKYDFWHSTSKSHSQFWLWRLVCGQTFIHSWHGVFINKNNWNCKGPNYIGFPHGAKHIIKHVIINIKKSMTSVVWPHWHGETCLDSCYIQWDMSRLMLPSMRPDHSYFIQ